MKNTLKVQGNRSYGLELKCDEPYASIGVKIIIKTPFIIVIIISRTDNKM